MSRLVAFAAFAAFALSLSALPGWAVAQAPPPAAAAPAPTPPTTVIREDGLVAEYYAADPATASRGAVLVLGGSEGGLDGSRGIARRLAAEGLDALAVAYFGEPGLPTKLDMVPVEPVGRGLAWLQARPEGAEPIAVVGVSKGAELALLTASRDGRIRAVVAGAPSSVVWQGIDQTGGPTGGSWTAAGEAVPYVPYDMTNGFRGIYSLYADSLAKAAPEAEIPVERIAGPILLVSASDDGVWPAADMAGRIQARLSANAFAHPVESLVYDGAGHAVFGAPIAVVTPQMQAIFGFLGGTPEGLTVARADGWPKVVAFLKTALAD